MPDDDDDEVYHFRCVLTRERERERENAYTANISFIIWKRSEALSTNERAHNLND